MTALATNAQRTQLHDGGRHLRLPLTAGFQPYLGQALFRALGTGTIADYAATRVFAGICADANLPATAADVNVIRRGVWSFAKTSPVLADVDKLCYFADNNTVTLTPGTPLAGKIVGLDPDDSGAVLVDVGPALDASPIAAANQAALGAQTQDTLTDSSGGTASTTIAAITQSANVGSADVGPVKDGFATLASENAKSKADILAVRTLLTELRADLIAAGLIKGGA